MNEEKIEKINEVITHYFNINVSINWIPVKEIMPALVEAGVFVKDEKKGLPLRKILRKLDKVSELSKMPFVHAERRSENTYWYLVREGKEYAPKELISPITNNEKRRLDIQNSDETYLINLCDELLEQKASRKHTFETIVGKLHKRGKGRTKLPLDAYYEGLKLVIEFFEKNVSDDDSENSRMIDKKEQERITQRNYYDQLKKEGVLKKKLRLIEINYSMFECNTDDKLVRNIENDKLVLKGLLKDFLEMNN